MFLKKTCQKIQYLILIDADNNYGNIQFAQNAGRRTQKKHFQWENAGIIHPIALVS